MTKILITMAILFSTISFAGFKCKEQSNSGISAEISNDNSSVIIKKGRKIIEKMGCSKITNRPRGADIEYPILKCKNPIADGGHIFEVRAGGYSGEIKAVLSKLSYAGTETIAKYLCKQ